MPIRELLRRCTLPMLGILAVAGIASTSLAQVTLDTPQISITREGFFRIDADVKAGASGAPNGFSIQWMKKADFDAFGWPASETDPYVAYCDFTGEPTLNLDSRSTTFALAPNATIGVQMGDLFDETGIYTDYADPLQPGAYVLRVLAEGSTLNNTVSSAFSATVFAATPNAECTQGFWKNHPEVWPSGCTPMTLGTVSYTAAQLLQIYNTPATGNGLISLAHQLITVKLNICNGSSPTNIQSTVNSADAAIGALVIPPIGSGFLSPGSTSGMTQTMDDYNNGLIPGVVACVTPTKHSSWGSLKALYR